MKQFLVFILLGGTFFHAGAQQVKATRTLHYIFLIDSAGNHALFDSTYHDVYKMGNKTIYSIPYIVSSTREGDMDVVNMNGPTRNSYFIFSADSAFGIEYDPENNETMRKAVDSVLKYHKTFNQEIDSFFSKVDAKLVDTRVNPDSGTVHEIYQFKTTTAPFQTATAYIDYSNIQLPFASTGILKQLEAGNKQHAHGFTVFGAVDCAPMVSVQMHFNSTELPVGKISPVVLKLFAEYPSIKAATP